MSSFGDNLVGGDSAFTGGGGGGTITGSSGGVAGSRLPSSGSLNAGGYANFSAGSSAGSSSTSTAGIPGTTLPSWLGTNAANKFKDLSQQYGSLTSGNPFGVNQVTQDELAQGKQAATNAANQYAATLAQSGATALGTGTVKAQNLASTYSNVANQLLDTREKAASMAGQIATTIGQLKTSYLGMLAGTYSSLRGQNTNWAINQRNQSDQQQQVSGTGTAASANAGGYGGSKFNPGYETSYGPIDPGSGYSGANGNNLAVSWGNGAGIS